MREGHAVSAPMPPPGTMILGFPAFSKLATFRSSSSVRRSYAGGNERYLDPIRTDQAIFPRAVFAADHRRSISCTACVMCGRYLRAANSGVIDVEKKIRFRLPGTGPGPRIGSGRARLPASDPPRQDAVPL